MIIVLTMNGKGSSKADYVKADVFQSLQEANDYIFNTNDTGTKYWTRAEIVCSGERVDTYNEGY